MKKTLVVLPSYNERQNILQLIQALIKTDAGIFVCVVDDSSPDGTSEFIRDTLEKDPALKSRVHLIVRSKKDGRGGAVRAGMEWGFGEDRSFDSFVEMDCDFSHRPEAVLQGLSFLDGGADVALGCRYPDGTIIGWPVGRRVFSFFANFLARTLIDWRIPDYTNGFRFYTRHAAQIMLSFPQRYKGYIYLSESLSHLIKAGMIVRCFPIVFKNRERGVSNTSLKEITNAFSAIFTIAWRHRFL